MPDRYQKIGEVLAKARQDQKKNLVDAAEATKIMAKYLEAVETGNPSKLPSEPYFMLFARSYAQYLGVDAKIFEEIRNAVPEPVSGEEAVSDTLETAPVKPPVSRLQSAPSSANRSSGLGVIILIVILLAAIGAGGFFAYKYWKSRASTPATSDTTEPADNNAGTPADPMAKDSDVTYPAYKTPESLILAMEVRKNQKAVVVIDGDTVLNREIIAGETQQWEARYRYQLAFALPDGVDLALNGIKLLLFPDRPGVGWEINQANYTRYYPTAADSLRFDSLQKAAAARPSVKKK
jgi:cytoskeleton protein RodZ